MNLEQCLRNVPLFADLDAAEMAALIGETSIKHFPRNAVIINEGDITDSLYVIVSGNVKIFVDDEKGRELILNTQGPGEFLGELALLDEAPRSASVMTMEVCEFIIISKQAFTKCLLDNPVIALKLVKTLTKRIRILSDNVKHLALEDVYGRVTRILKEMARPCDEQWVIDRKLTHRDLACMVGSSREMVSRIMKDLIAGGYITNDSGRVILRKTFPAAW